MSSVIYRLQYQTNLTHAEKECASYILQNIHEVPGKSITELAYMSGYSTATISRLCKKINHSGFELFQQELSTELTHHDLNANFPFDKGNSIKDVRDKLELLYDATIKETIEGIDEGVTTAIVDAIENVSSLTVYSSAQYLNHASILQAKMVVLDHYVNVIPQQYYFAAAKASGPSSVSIILSYEDDDRLIKTNAILKKQGGKIILISSPRAKTLIENCTYHIALADLEKPEVKISTFSSLLSMAYALDYLIGCLFMRHYDDNMKRHINTGL